MIPTTVPMTFDTPRLPLLRGMSTATELPVTTAALPANTVCANDRCPDFIKIGARRYVGKLLPGCSAQCRKCGKWVTA